MRSKHSTTPPDPRLMRGFAAGDVQASEDLYDRYASRIYGLGLVMLGNEAAAEDLVQDAFVKLLRTADRYDPARGSLDTWVLLVARSLALDTLRRRVLEARTVQATRPLDDADPEPGPDRVAETKDLVERARAAMAGLTDGQRAALELAYFGGKTSAEVAEMEGIPLGTAKTRIRSGLLRLREALQPDPRGDAA
ncbi:MAG TPA: sigma-70 family RNA polymerase sigma factor [Actinomycetota bacterium]|nr:sigma-70 family RNA polymerase sigma factor [Actinomycetota bacterium]